VSEHLMTAADVQIIKRALRAYAASCADRASEEGDAQVAARAAVLAESIEVTEEGYVTIPERMFRDLMQGKYAAYALSAHYRSMMEGRSPSKPAQKAL
jgi:hypothetical protein